MATSEQAGRRPSRSGGLSLCRPRVSRSPFHLTKEVRLEQLLLAVHEVVDEGVEGGVQHPFLEHAVGHEEVKQQELAVGLRLRLVVAHRAVGAQGEVDTGALLAKAQHGGANSLEEGGVCHLWRRHDGEAVGVEFDDVVAEIQLLDALEGGVQDAGVAEVAEFHAKPRCLSLAGCGGAIVLSDGGCGARAT